MTCTYRIVSQIWNEFIVSCRIATVLPYCIASEHGYRLLSYRALLKRNTSTSTCMWRFIMLSEQKKILASKSKPYRIALAGLSSLSVSRVIANNTYREISNRHLSCTYRIVSYRQIQDHSIRTSSIPLEFFHASLTPRPPGPSVLIHRDSRLLEDRVMHIISSNLRTNGCNTEYFNNLYLYSDALRRYAYTTLHDNSRDAVDNHSSSSSRLLLKYHPL